MLDIGTKVKIKSASEIRETLENGYCNHVLFIEEMYDYCGKNYTIKSQHANGCCAFSEIDNTYYWRPEWFDIVDKPKYLNDGSVEQRSLCLALIRQVMSGNKPNLNLLITNSNLVYPSKELGGFFYTDFPDDRWDHTRKTAGNIPDWPCLNLKPDILEEAIRNCLSEHNLQYFKGCIIYNITCWFIFNSTEKSGFWYDVSDKLICSSEISKEINIKQPIKTQENEIKFQRRKSTVIRGAVPEGNQQSSGKCKTATRSGYLSYQVCSGR